MNRLHFFTPHTSELPPLARAPPMVHVLFIAAFSAIVAGDDACDTSLTFAAWHDSTPIDFGHCGKFGYEDEAAAGLKSCSFSDEDFVSSSVCLMLRRGWWQAARVIVPSLSTAARGPIRRFLQEHRAGASEVLHLTRQGGDSQYTLVTPAVLWAQNESCVALAVRFSPKKHGPVSVASVDEPKVELNDSHVYFEALAHPFQRKPLRFVLELDLSQEIVAADSTWSLSSGRLTATLAKREHATWTRLDKNHSISSVVRHGPISTWFEMAEHFRGGAEAPELSDREDTSTKKPPSSSSTSSPSVSSADTKKATGNSKRKSKRPRTSTWRSYLPSWGWGS